MLMICRMTNGTSLMKLTEFLGATLIDNGWDGGLQTVGEVGGIGIVRDVIHITRLDQLINLGSFYD